MIRLPTARKPREIADWIEAELIFGNRDSLSMTEVRALLSDDFGYAEEWSDATFAEDHADLGALDHDEELLLENVEAAFLLLEQRSLRTGVRYPLTASTGRWEYSKDWSSALEYGFLVLLNTRVLLGLGSTVDHHEPAILFERLVKTALASYLCGDAARFGVPHPDFSGDFTSRARALAVKIQERPVRDLSTVTAHQGDYGLDVIGWRSFDDRESKIVVLCQCGIGADFEGKVLPVERWKRVIDFACNPVTALAIPFQDFGSGPKVRSLTIDAGILLDRSRISKFANMDLDETLADDLTAWIRTAIPSFLQPDEADGE